MAGGSHYRGFKISLSSYVLKEFPPLAGIILVLVSDGGHGPAPMMARPTGVTAVTSQTGREKKWTLVGKSDSPVKPTFSSFVDL